MWKYKRTIGTNMGNIEETYQKNMKIYWKTNKGNIYEKYWEKNWNYKKIIGNSTKYTRISKEPMRKYRRNVWRLASSDMPYKNGGQTLDVDFFNCYCYKTDWQTLYFDV